MIVSKLKELEGLKNIGDLFMWNLKENRELNDHDLNPNSTKESETDSSFDISGGGCGGSASALAFGSNQRGSEKRKADLELSK